MDPELVELENLNEIQTVVTRITPEHINYFDKELKFVNLTNTAFQNQKDGVFKNFKEHLENFKDTYETLKSHHKVAQEFASNINSPDFTETINKFVLQLNVGVQKINTNLKSIDEVNTTYPSSSDLTRKDFLHSQSQKLIESAISLKENIKSVLETETKFVTFIITQIRQLKSKSTPTIASNILDGYVSRLKPSTNETNPKAVESASPTKTKAPKNNRNTIKKNQSKKTATAETKSSEVTFPDKPESLKEDSGMAKTAEITFSVDWSKLSKLSTVGLSPNFIFAHFSEAIWELLRRIEIDWRNIDDNNVYVSYKTKGMGTNFSLTQGIDTTLRVANGPEKKFEKNALDEVSTEYPNNDKELSQGFQSDYFMQSRMRNPRKELISKFKEESEELRERFDLMDPHDKIDETRRLRMLMASYYEEINYWAVVLRVLVKDLPDEYLDAYKTEKRVESSGDSCCSISNSDREYLRKFKIVYIKQKGSVLFRVPVRFFNEKNVVNGRGFSYNQLEFSNKYIPDFDLMKHAEALEESLKRARLDYEEMGYRMLHMRQRTHSCRENSQLIYHPLRAQRPSIEWVR